MATESLPSQEYWCQWGFLWVKLAKETNIWLFLGPFQYFHTLRMVEGRKRKACAYKKKKFVQRHHLIAYNVEEITDIFFNKHTQRMPSGMQYTIYTVYVWQYALPKQEFNETSLVNANFREFQTKLVLRVPSFNYRRIQRPLFENVPETFEMAHKGLSTE